MKKGMQRDTLIFEHFSYTTVEIQMSFTNSCASKIELTSCLIFKLHRGSKMSAYALMNLSNELRKR